MIFPVPPLLTGAKLQQLSTTHIGAQTLKLKDDYILAGFLADPNLCYHFHTNFVQRPFQDFWLTMARNDFPIAEELHKW